MYMLRSEPDVTAAPVTRRQRSIIIIRQLRPIRQPTDGRKEKGMKEHYDAPEMKVILLEEEDILTTSYPGITDANPEGAGTNAF